TFDQSLMGLYRKELITYDEAMRQASNPDDFALHVRGITSPSDARWDSFDTAGQTSAASGGQGSAVAATAPPQRESGRTGEPAPAQPSARTFVKRCEGRRDAH